jgi:hypothetical protein
MSITVPRDRRVRAGSRGRLTGVPRALIFRERSPAPRKMSRNGVKGSSCPEGSLNQISAVIELLKRGRWGPRSAIRIWHSTLRRDLLVHE